MKVIREIGIYQKNGEKLLRNFEINLSLNRLINILEVDIKNDPKAFKVYEINKNQYFQFAKYIPELLKIDFEKVSIYYECSQME